MHTKSNCNVHAFDNNIRQVQLSITIRYGSIRKLEYISLKFVYIYASKLVRFKVFVYILL